MSAPRDWNDQTKRAQWRQAWITKTGHKGAPGEPGGVPFEILNHFVTPCFEDALEVLNKRMKEAGLPQYKIPKGKKIKPIVAGNRDGELFGAGNAQSQGFGQQAAFGNPQGQGEFWQHHPHGASMGQQGGPAFGGPPTQHGGGFGSQVHQSGAGFGQQVPQSHAGGSSRHPGATARFGATFSGGEFGQQAPQSHAGGTSRRSSRHPGATARLGATFGGVPSAPPSGTSRRGTGSKSAPDGQW